MPAEPINVPEAIFPADDFGVPWLDSQLQAEFVEAPVAIWGQVSRRSRSTRTWLFYCEDRKFATLDRNPQALVDTRAATAGEVNHSLSWSAPWAVALWATYRKRWLARYWQTQGVRILVDMNVPRKWDGLNLLGVPSGWRCYCTRAADAERDRLMEQVEIARAKAGTDDVVMAVYGGGPATAALCSAERLIHLQHAADYARLQQCAAQPDNNARGSE